MNENGNGCGICLGSCCILCAPLYLKISYVVECSSLIVLSEQIAGMFCVDYSGLSSIQPEFILTDLSDYPTRIYFKADLSEVAKGTTLCAS